VSTSALYENVLNNILCIGEHGTNLSVRQWRIHQIAHGKFFSLSVRQLLEHRMKKNIEEKSKIQNHIYNVIQFRHKLYVYKDG
jgi:hypothetical protein